MDQDTRNLKTESELYMTLARLLEEKRSSEAEQKVLEISRNQALSVEDKIHQIKEIDGATFHNSRLYLLKNAPEEESAPTPETGLHQPPETAESRIQTRLSLIHQPLRQGMLRFLIREMPRLKAFAQKTGVLRCRYFPPGVRLASGIEQFFLRRIHPLAEELLAGLEYIEENGWLYLSKAHYNLLREFQLLCRRIAQLPREKPRTGEKNPCARFRRLEDQFFLCHFNPSYPETIVSAIQDVLGNARQFEGRARELARNAQRLLTLSEEGPSLHAILLGMYIVQARRMVELPDLLNRKSGAVINTTVFQCKAEVRQAIDCYLEQKTKSMDLLYKQHLQLIRFKAYLRFDRSGDPDFTILETMIEAMRAPEDFYKQLDNDNLLQSAAVLGEYLDPLAHQLLRDAVPVAEREEPVQLFTRDTFHELLGNLNHTADEVGRLAAKSRHILISRERMAGATERIVSTATTSHGEIEAMELILTLSEAFFNLGEAVARVVDRGKAQTREEPLELRDYRKDNLFIPYAGGILTMPGLLEGESVSGALGHLTTLCYTAAWFLQNRKISILFEKQRQLENDLHGIFRIVEQLSSPAQLEQIRTRFPHV